MFTYVFAYGLIDNYGYLRKYGVQEQEDKIITKDVKANDPGMLLCTVGALVSIALQKSRKP